MRQGAPAFRDHTATIAYRTRGDILHNGGNSPNRVALESVVELRMSILRDDAVEIWKAGVAAVDSARLVAETVQRRGDQLDIAGETFALSEIERIVVVGGGKAGAGMARGLEQALGADVVRDRVTGWVNVPADCVTTLQRIHLHAGRPAGVNEPTPEGIAGTERILSLVQTLGPRDVCLVLISGGGSALLPAPVAGLSLADKQRVTRALMHAGATIEQLNAVRSCLSRVKAGGLWRSMADGRGVALIISDVIGDPLAVIASGPTTDVRPCPRQALEILEALLPREAVPAGLWSLLAAQMQPTDPSSEQRLIPFRNVIIGNNRTAVVAAEQRARELGYAVAFTESDRRGIARDVGRELAARCLEQRTQETSARGWCLISGGEPTVQLVPTNLPRLGGRNQELVLSAAEQLWDGALDGLVLLSGGTDGEDGPTDAAGALFDAAVQAAARSQHLTPGDFLAINNSYPFFAASGGLLQTGPTHTNVMDLRVALVQPMAHS